MPLEIPCSPSSPRWPSVQLAGPQNSGEHNSPVRSTDHDEATHPERGSAPGTSCLWMIRECNKKKIENMSKEHDAVKKDHVDFLKI